MTITETLARGTALLNARRIESPGLDAALLLAETLRVSREKLIQRGPDPLPDTESRLFFQLIDRRIAGECTAYILGRKEFRGLDFLVNPAVLVPRPDTETLVEAALKRLGVRSEELEVEKTGTASISPSRPQTSSRSSLPSIPSLLDLCTGSGAVAVALKNECPEIEVFASDISSQALETARLNAARLLGTEIASALTFIQSDLFDRIPRRFHLITANPPYVSAGDIKKLSPEVQGEPRLALDGGEDGLDIIRALVSQAPDHLFPGGVLLLEADPRQMPLIAPLLEHQGFLDIQTYRDLSGAERVTGGRIREEPESEKIGAH
ncbi:MAG: peptide chain release factor N(5)-glutamine methyltransferase [Treponema sp.]|jgi:release factor glutamine methyltransferase|nr:peptide chain release factor N(5)-glutamine methyltransferase [Treponema sp.]